MQKLTSPVDLDAATPLDWAPEQRKTSRPIARIHILGAMRATPLSR